MYSLSILRQDRNLTNSEIVVLPKNTLKLLSLNLISVILFFGLAIYHHNKSCDEWACKIHPSNV
jgi:hypothetical protein